jgi:CRISPR-associated protein Csb2
MIVLQLSFPAGRYHATQWGRHVNEGTVEWPPSPWRIVRALIATWYLKAQEIPKETICSLVGALSQLPCFRLPSASTGHTRHYMPINKGKKTTKIFDTFVQLSERDAILVAWDVILPPGQLAALQILAGRLGYFGRAESLVEARVLEGITAIEPNAMPLTEGAPLPAKTELVRLLAPMMPVDYKTWRTDFLSANAPPIDGEKSDKKKAKVLDAPDDLFTALRADTGELQSAGWNVPPGALYVNYIRPENAFAPATKPSVRCRGEKPTVARFALTSVVPPSITRALAVGEQIHTILCKESNGHPIFTGAGAQGHQHAHIFTESTNDRHAHITHVTVFAPAGFDDDAIQALRSILWTWGFKRHELRLVLHGIGQPGDFKDCALFGKARVWRSLTPFVSTRHTKAFRDGRPKMDASGWQVGSGAHDLLRLLALHPQGTAATIKQCDERDGPFQFGNRHLRSLQFQTIRHGGSGNRGNSSGNAFIVTFPEPVNGPLAFGYGSHFGLGLFLPIMDGGTVQPTQGDSEESVRNQSKI